LRGCPNSGGKNRVIGEHRLKEGEFHQRDTEDTKLRGGREIGVWG